MASLFEVLLPAGTGNGWAAVSDAFAVVHRLESQLSVFREDSELSQLNQRAAGGPVAVQQNLLELLLLGLQISRQTGGAFDFTSAPLSRCWGFMQRAGRVPDQGEIARVLQRVGWGHLEIDSAAGTVCFKRPLEVNLGAIGKGYALDQAAASLRKRFESYLMHAGHSTIVAAGDGPDQHASGWRIGLRHPFEHGSDFAEVRLKSGALSTSGAAEQKFSSNGRDYGHIIDPRTGYPAATNLSATALAPNAALADALSTAFYLMSIEEVTAFCESHREIGAVVVSAAEGSELRIHRFGLDSNRWEVSC